MKRKTIKTGPRIVTLIYVVWGERERETETEREKESWEWDEVLTS